MFDGSMENWVLYEYMSDVITMENWESYENISDNMSVHISKY